MSRRVKILSSKIIFHGRVFDVRRDTVIEPGGVRATRELVVHNGSVVVLPILDDGRLLLIRQYRQSVGGYLWELVAGRIERGERPLPGAKRELLEETATPRAAGKKFSTSSPLPASSANACSFTSRAIFAPAPRIPKPTNASSRAPSLRAKSNPGFAPGN
ncbi:MAG: NUDIX domain-containing protein [Candidatus Acidiferrales bacterium]